MYDVYDLKGSLEKKEDRGKEALSIIHPILQTSHRTAPHTLLSCHLSLMYKVGINQCQSKSRK